MTPAPTYRSGRTLRRRAINALLRLPTGLASRFRVAGWRVLGMRVERRCRLARIDVARNPWDIHLRHHVALDPGVVLLATGEPTGRPKIVIGPEVYVNRGTFFDASLSIVVGSKAMIGPHCYLTDHDHGMAAGELVQSQPLLAAPVVIGEGAWLGARVVVLKGVHVGEGAVVGAGSVVTRSIPPNAIAAGVPARVIRYRDVAAQPRPPLQHASC